MWVYLPPQPNFEFDVTAVIFGPDAIVRLQVLCTCDPPLTGVHYTCYIPAHDLTCEYAQCLQVMYAVSIAILRLEPNEQKKALKRVQKVIHMLDVI